MINITTVSAAVTIVTVAVATVVTQKIVQAVSVASQIAYQMQSIVFVIEN